MELVRWGARSTGGIVKAGYGGWALSFYALTPAISYTDPDTGNSACAIGWNLVGGREWARQSVDAANARMTR